MLNLPLAKKDLELKKQEMHNSVVSKELENLKEINNDIYLLNDYIEGYGNFLKKEFFTLINSLYEKYPNHIDKICLELKDIINYEDTGIS
jgi:hypothetical protein